MIVHQLRLIRQDMLNAVSRFSFEDYLKADSVKLEWLGKKQVAEKRVEASLCLHLARDEKSLPKTRLRCKINELREAQEASKEALKISSDLNVRQT